MTGCCEFVECGCGHMIESLQDEIYDIETADLGVSTGMGPLRNDNQSYW